MVSTGVPIIRCHEADAAVQVFAGVPLDELRTHSIASSCSAERRDASGFWPPAWGTGNRIASDAVSGHSAASYPASPNESSQLCVWRTLPSTHSHVNDVQCGDFASELLTAVPRSHVHFASAARIALAIGPR